MLRIIKIQVLIEVQDVLKDENIRTENQRSST